MLLAITGRQQEQGLMGRRSLGGHAGMVFLFPSPVDDLFYMRNTPIALSIAWFSSRGRYLASATMPPCPDGEVRCPTYRPEEPYKMAVEVPAGGLTALGIGPGSTLTLGGPCSV